MIDVERIIAVEMREHSDPVAQAFDEMVKVKVWTRDDFSVGFQMRRREESEREG